MPLPPTADNNWGRPPTTQQLRDAGLLINARVGPPSPLAPGGKTFGGVDGFYELQGKPALGQPVDSSMFSQPSWSKAGATMGQADAGHSWNTHPSTGAAWEVPGPSVGTTAYSRPSSSYESSLLPPPEVMPRSQSPVSVPQAPPGFSGSLPALALKSRYGTGESTFARSPSADSSQSKSAAVPHVFDGTGSPFFAPGNRIFGQGAYAPPPPFRRPGGIASRAYGGPLETGQTSLVGERGPELIVPRVPVDVVPMGPPDAGYDSGLNSPGPVDMGAPASPPAWGPSVQPVPNPVSFGDAPPAPPDAPSPPLVSYGDPQMQLLRSPAPIPRDFSHGPRYGSILPAPGGWPTDADFVPPAGGSKLEFEQLLNQHGDTPHLSRRLQDYHAAIWAHQDYKDRLREETAKAVEAARKEAAVQGRFDTVQQNTDRRQQSTQTVQERQKQQAAAEKQFAEDLAYRDAVSKLQNRWQSGQFTPQDMIRFEGLQTSKAIEAELDHLEKQQAEKTKAERPPVITDLPTDRPVAVGSGASPRLSIPNGQKEIMKVSQVVTDADGATKRMEVPHYIEHDENGQPYLVPVPIGKPTAPGAAPATPAVKPATNPNDFINGVLNKKKL